MGDSGSVLVLLVFLGVLLLHGVLIAVVAPRVLRVVRVLRDPQRRGALLSPATRQALREAGLDPDGFGLTDLGAHPELGERVGREVAHALRGALGDALGPLGRVVLRRREPGTPPRLPDGSTSTPAPLDLGAMDPTRPPPLDTGGDATGARLFVALGVAGTVGAALWWLTRG